MSKKFIIRDPFGLLREGVIKSKGYARWRDNILAARAVGDLLKPCFGPKGAGKIIMDKFGETAFTNHGYTVLDKLDIHHPVAKLLKEAAKTVENSVGDGTKTAIILISELLYKTDELTASNIKVGKILEGYHTAYQTCLAKLKQVSKPISLDDKSSIEKLVLHLVRTRMIENSEYLSRLITSAIMSAVKRTTHKLTVDREAIRIVKKLGASVEESRIIHGIVLDTNIVHPAMPRYVRDARIAVLNLALKLDEFRHLQPYKYHLSINTSEKMKDFVAEEKNVVKNMAEKILAIGANVVVTRKKMSPVAKQLLSRAGVIGISRLLNEDDFMGVAKMTGSRVVSSIDDLSEEHLGFASYVGEEKVGGTRVVVFDGVKNLSGATILLRAPSERLLSELEHVVKDAVRFVSALMEDPACVPGGGAGETAMALAVEKEASRYHGVQQEAMRAFAKCLEALPKTLIENSGLDVPDTYAKIRAMQLDGEHDIGFDSFSGKVTNVVQTGLLEPIQVKRQALTTAVETANALLRIDELVDRRYAKRHEGELGGQ